MKPNRYIPLVVTALMVLGALAFTGYKAAYAQGATPPTQTQSCAQDQADGTEVKDATDTDTVELQCGEQVEDGQPDGAEAVGAADTDNVNAEEQVGDQNAADTGIEETEAAEAPEAAQPALP
jgi:hypothetical protein